MTTTTTAASASGSVRPSRFDFANLDGGFGPRRLAVERDHRVRFVRIQREPRQVVVLVAGGGWRQREAGGDGDGLAVGVAEQRIFEPGLETWGSLVLRRILLILRKRCGGAF